MIFSIKSTINRSFFIRSFFIRKIYFLILFCLLIELNLSRNLYAQNSLNLSLHSPISANNIEQQLKFAEYLLTINDYNRAITEYERLLFIYSDAPPAIILKLAEIYLKTGHIQSSIDLISRNADRIKKNQKLFYLAVAYLTIDQDRPYPLRTENISRAIENLNNIDIEFSNYDNIQAFVQSEENKNTNHYKSPFLAGVYSTLIPGLGSIYADRIKSGIYSFLIVSMFAIAYFESAKNEKYENWQPFFAALTVTFYAGSIYAAVNSTHLYNSDLETNRLIQAQTKYQIYLNYNF